MPQSLNQQLSREQQIAALEKRLGTKHPLEGCEARLFRC